MIVIRHGRRAMQLAWTHLLPSTFGGTARFNVAERPGRGGRRVRRGRRRCTTSGRACAPSRRATTSPPAGMNQVDVNDVDVIVDYCHNAPGMRVLGDFVERYVGAEGRARPTSASSRGSA